jgi:hypothetical protein
MDPQIEGYLLQLTSTSQDLPGVAGDLAHYQFNWRSSADKWSVGQCVEHLNITTERYVPVLRRAMADARAAGKLATGPFMLGFLERWFLSSMEPPPKRRFRTGKPFVAAANLNPAVTLERWKSLQTALAECIRDAEGLDLKKIKVRSQFGPVSWTLNGTFAILLAHERRHIWQAREVRKDPAFPVG